MLLGVVELHSKHTASNLSVCIKNTLQAYDIDLTQISSFTSDNGANMVRAGSILRQHQHSKRLSERIESYRNELSNDSDDENDNNSSDDENDNESSDDEANFIKMVQGALEILYSTMSLVKCAAHCLQLGVHESIKKLSLNQRNAFDECRKVVKAIKSSTYQEQVRRLKLSIPCVDVLTRWNSTYMMTSGLEALRDQWDNLYDSFDGRELANIQISEDTWNFISSFNRTFKVPFMLTQKIQKENLAFGKNI